MSLAPSTREQSTDYEWLPTACILCAENCGIEVQVEDGHLKRIRGDKAHPASRGYLCQKASRLDHYVNHADRLTTPLRRRPDGTFEEVDWDTAITEVANRLITLRDRHGGHSLAYVGGGGQGNHLGGIYGNALKAAMNTGYHYSSLAQEKTGGFWVNGKLFGRQSCHPTHDVPNADFVLFLGTNPWMSHGFPRARKVLQEIKRDANRRMVVVDPWRTKTAEMADVHLQVKPGRDAFLFAAMLGHIFQKRLYNRDFLEAHCLGTDKLHEVFRPIPVDEYCQFAGCDPGIVKQVVRDYVTSEKATIRADLGLEHSWHSTLNDYLGKLLFLVTGHFGKPGANNLHAQFLPLLGHSGDADRDPHVLKTKVTGFPEISKLFPPNILPAEINSSHPNRVRGVFVESMNPLVTGADTQAYREAFKKLELLVVLDVSMTETAEQAHYILPASSQYEKWEATFFGTGMPLHHFHLRAPILEPLPGTLPEPEIHRRLLLAMGETPETNPLLGVVDQLDRRAPELKDGCENLRAVAAPILMGCQGYARRYPEAVRRARIKANENDLGIALFEAILSERSGIEIGQFGYEDSFRFIRHKDGKIHLVIPKLLDWLTEMDAERFNGKLEDTEFPFILSAGGRRSYNANTIMRDPQWRRSDQQGAMRIHPSDLSQLGIKNGDRVVCESRRGCVTAVTQANDAAQPGYVNLPHGYGLGSTTQDGSREPTGVLVNELTAAEECDPIAKTPYHKTVRVRIRPFK